MDTDCQLPQASRIFFWLVPAKAHRQPWENIINRLADEYGAPRFMPHVTVLSTCLTQDESPQQILAAATKDTAYFRLETRGVDHGADPFKAVFVRLDSEPIAPLWNTLRASCRQPGNYRLDAHMSLLYHHLPVEKRQTLTANLELPEGPICFDSVVAVRPGHKRNTLLEVTQWRIVAEVDLPAGALPHPS